MSVFGIVENFVAAFYAGTRGILSGFFIILGVLVEHVVLRTGQDLVQRSADNDTFTLCVVVVVGGTCPSKEWC